MIQNSKKFGVTTAGENNGFKDVIHKLANIIAWEIEHTNYRNYESCPRQIENTNRIAKVLETQLSQ